MSRVYPLETSLERDLYTFSQYEIEDVIKNLSTVSIKTANTVFSIIKNYIQWTVDIGKNVRGENPCNKIILSDIIRLNKNAIKELYMSREEFYDYIYGLEGSDVDKCAIMLLRYGITMNDLVELKWNDIDEEKLIIHTEKIDYPIDELLIKCIHRSKECDEYKLFEPKDNKNRSVKYIENEYVCKQTVSAKTGMDKVSLHSLHTRVRKIFSNNGLQKINVIAMRTMPIFDMMYNIYQKNGKITREEVYECMRMYSENKSQESLWSKMAGIRENFKIIFNIDIVK